MKVKLIQIYTNRAVLVKIAGFELEAGAAIRLSRFMVAAQREIELIEAQRHKLIQRYGKDQDGVLQVTADNHESFIADFNAILQDEVDIYDPRLTSDILEGQRLSAVDFFALAWLFDRDHYAGLTEVTDPESKREE